MAPPFMKRRFLQYKKHGDPKKVVSFEHGSLSTSLSPTHVLVQWLAAPIHPLDIYKMQGESDPLTHLPSTPGSEGMGKVISIGANVTNVAVGDSVAIFTAAECPTYAEYSVVDGSTLIKLDPSLPALAGATLMINPPTAWLMLKKFVELKKGDWIIQNSGNSSVGRAVIQLAKAYGFNTIAVVRKRADIAELKTELQSIGASTVLTEEEMAAGQKFKTRPRLALDGVGGKSCLAIADALDLGGTLITYADNGKKPHEISTSALVLNDITVRGVSVGRWMREDKKGRKEEVDAMFKELQELMVKGTLTAPPMDEWPLERFQDAFEASVKAGHRKQCFVNVPRKNSVA